MQGQRCVVSTASESGSAPPQGVAYSFLGVHSHVQPTRALHHAYLVCVSTGTCSSIKDPQPGSPAPYKACDERKHMQWGQGLATLSGTCGKWQLSRASPSHAEDALMPRVKSEQAPALLLQYNYKSIVHSKDSGNGATARAFQCDSAAWRSGFYVDPLLTGLPHVHQHQNTWA
jgi:hypothetical protein